MSILAMSWFSPRQAFANIAPCSSDINIPSVQPGSQTVFDFTITNNDANEDIRSVKFLRPSGNFEIVAGYNAGWYIQVASDEITFTDGSIEPGGSQILSVEAIAGTLQASTANWTVLATNQSDFSDTVDCIGQTSTSISSQVPFSINGVATTNIATTSATITYLTNRPATSKVNYGKSTNYGQSVQLSDGNLRTQHTLDLTNLQPNTTYHYQVSSTDASNQTVMSSDNTFTTPPVPRVVAPTPSSDTTTNTSGVRTDNISLISNPYIKAKPTETIPPKLESRTKIEKVYKDTPTISGEATDEAAIALVEYSVDGGENWLPVDTITGLGTNRATFSFTPKNLQDGNYTLMLRATDSSINQTTKNLGIFVIDKLPPIVGGVSTSVGAQLTQPDNEGTMYALAGVDQKIVLSAVGGATSINLEAYANRDQKPVQVYGLSQSDSTGLWSGTMSFAQGGNYELRVKSVDGAGNQISRVIGIIKVSNKGKVVDVKTKARLDADVTVFYKDPQTGAWLQWNGQTYSQSNPARLGNDSGYGFYLPAGTYYLKFTKKGYYPVRTKSIVLTAPGPVSSDIMLHKAPGVSIGSSRVQLPSFGSARLERNNSIQNSGVKQDTKAKQLPVFDLPQTDGSRLKTLDLFGKPTVITLVSTWSTASQDQLPILAELAKEYPELKIVPLSSGESLSRLSAVSSIAGYKIPVVADTNNALLNSLGTSNLPTHYFIDRRGIVVKHVVGVLSKEEILKNVAN